MGYLPTCVLIDLHNLLNFLHNFITFVCAEGSDAWLQALPASSLGLLLGYDELRIAVCLRQGATLVHPHTCCCGQPASAEVPADLESQGLLGGGTNNHGICNPNLVVPRQARCLGLHLL